MFCHLSSLDIVKLVFFNKESFFHQVTGSNKGIGFAAVRALCKQLDNGVVYLTSRNEERGKEAVAKLNKEGLKPQFHQLDIDDRTSVERLRDYLKKTYGGLDILINNAGIAFKVRINSRD